VEHEHEEVVRHIEQYGAAGCVGVAAVVHDGRAGSSGRRPVNVADADLDALGANAWAQTLWLQTLWLKTLQPQTLRL